MDPSKWKNIKKSGGFRRKVKNKQLALQIQTNMRNMAAERSQAGGSDTNEGSVSFSESVTNVTNPSDSTEILTDVGQNYYSDSEIDDDSGEDKNAEFRDKYKSWAIEHNIPHIAIRELNFILNKRMPYLVPVDPRTLLKTKKEIEVIHIDDGYYWHNGLIACLKTILENIGDKPRCVSLNVNIDGLPLFKSSKNQVWPILCQINERRNIAPFVVGIYEGPSKPKNLYAFFQPFVTELLEVMQDNLKIPSENGADDFIEVKIRAFICDSPARALVKGVCNFNAKHGCLKCTVVGEYSHQSHTVTFPKTDCPRRNDEDFRSKKYGDHHKLDSPLLQLPIDMIEQFPVGDSLHLIDLGIMKRLLFGWRDGNLGKLITKWSARQISTVTQFLLSCQMPKEIHRNVRSLNDLTHWKGSEFRTFILYLSFVILKDVLSTEAYQHFLLFFSAVTICTSEIHFNLLPVAEGMFKLFVDNYGKFYGREYITSNVHNLIHVVDEVKRYGILQSFNAYPFENKLKSIKRTIRHGNHPLQQIAKRLTERDQMEVENLRNVTNSNLPTMKTFIYKGASKTVIELECFSLSTDNENKWFLSNNNQLVEVRSATCNDGHIKIIGNQIQDLRSDVFETPIKSSCLNIFMIKQNDITRTEATFNVTDIKCKLVSIVYNSNIYFASLIHTLKNI